MENDERGGFLVWLSQQALPLRIAAFSFFVIAVVGVIFAATGLLYYFNVNNYPRLVPLALVDGVTTREFAQLNAADAYPAALAISETGTLYTGSYMTGAVWRIAPDGSSSEIAGTVDAIGSVISLETAAVDVYVLDHIAPLNSTGAKIWQINDAGISLLHDLPSILNANDLAIDAEGRFYVTDLQSGTIYRIDASGTNAWWQAPSSDYAPAALFYDEGRILISDAVRGEIYAIPTSATDSEAERTLLFATAETVGFNGIVMGSDDIVYAADLLNNQVWEIHLAGNARVLAGNYRGASNLAYDAAKIQLFVNNWDQSWLLPKDFFFMSFNIAPRLPFSIDMIELGE